MDVQVSNVEFGESKKSAESSGNVTRQQASNNSAEISEAIGDLGDFEEILSDGEVPF